MIFYFYAYNLKIRSFYGVLFDLSWLNIVIVILLNPLSMMSFSLMIITDRFMCLEEICYFVFFLLFFSVLGFICLGFIGWVFCFIFFFEVPFFSFNTGIYNVQEGANSPRAELDYWFSLSDIYAKPSVCQSWFDVSKGMVKDLGENSS